MAFVTVQVSLAYQIAMFVESSFTVQPTHNIRSLVRIRVRVRISHSSFPGTKRARSFRQRNSVTKVQMDTRQNWPHSQAPGQL